jgi:hypothetical protein
MKNNKNETNDQTKKFKFNLLQHGLLLNEKSKKEVNPLQKDSEF